MAKKKLPDWLQKDQQYVWHPYTQMLTSPPPVPIERAEGVYLYTSDGRRILDGISSWWVNIHGHGHPRLNQALQDQASKLAQVIFAGFTHEPAARLAEELVKRAPTGLTRAFFSNDGSTAVEVALKMAHQYWRHRGEPHRTLFIGLKDAYHGDTVATMAVSDVEVFRTHFRDFFFEVRHVDKCAERIEEILYQEHRRTAAFILEPLVQGAGGMILWPVELLRQVREMTRRYGILLIADEVFTGFGRTGELFACEHGPIEPDLMCLSKAITGGYLPLGATLCSEDIFRAFLSEDRMRTFFHGHSFTGNALSTAVALESLALMDEEKSLDRVRQIETIFSERLERLAPRSEIREVRGIGGLAAIELETGDDPGYLSTVGPRLSRAFLERGVLLRPLGNVLYFLPPYVITDEEIHRVFDIIEEVIENSVDS